MTEETITVNYSVIVNVSDYLEGGHDPLDIFDDPNTTIRLVLCFLALVANILSIAATSSIPRKLTPHMKLIISLGLSDSLVPVSILIHIINIMFNVSSLPSVRTEREKLTSSCIHQAVNSLNITAHLISLLNLLAMAADHYLAIMFPLQYKAFVCGKRTTILIMSIWLLAVCGGFSNFLKGFTTNSDDIFYQFNFCEKTFNKGYEAEYLVIASTFICLFVILYIYGRIYWVVRQLNSALTLPNSAGEQLHKNKKSMFTTALIIGSFVICWMPHMIFQIVMLTAVHTDPDSVRKFLLTYLQINDYAYNLIALNSICDPIIYAVRLKEVQIGYVRLLSRCFNAYKVKLANLKYKNSAHFACSRKVSSLTSYFIDVPDKSEEGEALRLFKYESNGKSRLTKPEDCDQFNLTTAVDGEKSQLTKYEDCDMFLLTTAVDGEKSQ